MVAASSTTVHVALISVCKQQQMATVTAGSCSACHYSFLLSFIDYNWHTATCVHATCYLRLLIPSTESQLCAVSSVAAQLSHIISCVADLTPVDDVALPAVGACLRCFRIFNEAFDHCRPCLPLHTVCNSHAQKNRNNYTLLK